jgi:hypothetical protein
MLLSMQTIDANDLVSAMFEACTAYAAGPDASPVCAGCGWLDAEHEPAVAEVRALPARRRAGATPKRLAS